MSGTLRKRIATLEARPIASTAIGWAAVLRHMSDADLTRMEVLSAEYGGLPDDQLPPEVRAEYQCLIRNTVAAIRAADLPGRDLGADDLSALISRLESKHA